ncbi:MAG: rhodanese-like domain-containing protein, partial [Rhodospirillaceae bacterium]
RSPGRFAGTEDEPRPNARKGRIPNSVNIPVPAFMDPKQHFAMRPADALQQAIDAAGLDPSKPMVASCGSGVTACVIALGCYLLGHKDVAVYDGSWAEWGTRDDTPVIRD